MRQTVRKNPAECTGCGACVSICPKQAIVMQPDTEGFLYPKVDGEKCISCDLCEKRCPAGREMPEHHARLLGAQAKDEALRRPILVGRRVHAVGTRGYPKGRRGVWRGVWRKHAR